MLDICFQGINITANNLYGPFKSTLSHERLGALLACPEETQKEARSGSNGLFDYLDLRSFPTVSWSMTTVPSPNLLRWLVVSGGGDLGFGCDLFDSAISLLLS